MLVDSQSAAKRLTDDAEKRAALMIESTTETCERILAEFREQIKVEINTLKALRKQVLDFKNKMFIQYQKHIELKSFLFGETDQIGDIQGFEKCDHGVGRLHPEIICGCSGGILGVDFFGHGGSFYKYKVVVFKRTI